MSTAIADCGCKDPGTREKACLCCDIPVFCRNNYYRGKLLTEREFADEQRYLIDKMRLHSVALHGWGVVCGLVVKPHPNPSETTRRRSGRFAGGLSTRRPAKRLHDGAVLEQQWEL